MRKPVVCICENIGAADQRRCFRYVDSAIPLLPESESPSLLSYSVAVQPGLCRTWSETPKTGFLAKRLKLMSRCLRRLIRLQVTVVYCNVI